MANVELKLAGLTCDSCIRSVTGILKSLDNVSDVKVELTKAEVSITEKNDEKIQELISAITDIGYEAQLA
ncbi:MAG: heavy-metal-associated domain-containing protein [Candidatus Thorarchaeota archaeon]